MHWTQYLLGSILILFSLIMIAVILLQEGRRKGISGTISGGADTFLSKGKARAVDAVLARWTKYVAVVFFMMVVLASVVAFLIEKKII